MLSPRAGTAQTMVLARKGSLYSKEAFTVCISVVAKCSVQKRITFFAISSSQNRKKDVVKGSTLYGENKSAKVNSMPKCLTLSLYFLKPAKISSVKYNQVRTKDLHSPSLP